MTVNFLGDNDNQLGNELHAHVAANTFWATMTHGAKLSGIAAASGDVARFVTELENTTCYVASSASSSSEAVALP